MFIPVGVQNGPIVGAVPNVPINQFVQNIPIAETVPNVPIDNNDNNDEFFNFNVFIDELNDLINKYDELNINIDLFHDYDKDFEKIFNQLNKFKKWHCSADEFNEIIDYLNNKYDELNINKPITFLINHFQLILNKLNILIIFIYLIDDNNIDNNIKLYNHLMTQFADLKIMFDNNIIREFKKIILMFKSSKYINYYYLYIDYINIFERFIRSAGASPINLLNDLINYLKISKILIIDSMKRKIKLNFNHINNTLDEFYFNLIDFIQNYGNDFYYYINELIENVDLIDKEIEDLEKDKDDYDDDDYDDYINKLYCFRFTFIDELKNLIDNEGEPTNKEINKKFGELIDDLIDLVENDDLIYLLKCLKFGNKFIIFNYDY